MIATRKFDKDNNGASLLIEYMFTIVIAAILFSVLLLNLQSIITRSDQIIMGEEMDISASIVANQLSDYSSQLKLNDYSSTYSLTTPQEMTRIFDVPRPNSGKQYTIEMWDEPGTGRGKVKVTYASDPEVFTILTFNTPVPVDHAYIVCNTYKLRISHSGNRIVMEEA